MGSLDVGEVMQTEDEETAKVLAALIGVATSPEHLAEVATALRLMTPHVDRVRAVQLGLEVEPASLFRP